MRELLVALAKALQFADRLVVLFVGSVCLGSAERYLGLLATRMEQWERAEEHFAEASRENQRIGACLWLAHTRLDWASMLRARGGQAALLRALELLRPCLASAAELGLSALESQAQALDAEIRRAPPDPNH